MGSDQDIAGSGYGMPRETILQVLHEALGQTRSDVDDVVDRLLSVYRSQEQLETAERVVALGFLACVKALHEASLMQEIAIREEIQDLRRLVESVLSAIERTEQVVRSERELLTQRREGGGRGLLLSDLSPSGEARGSGGTAPTPPS